MLIDFKRNRRAVESSPPDADTIILSFFSRYPRENSSVLNRFVKGSFRIFSLYNYIPSLLTNRIF